MTDGTPTPPTSQELIPANVNAAEDALIERLSSGTRKKYVRFVIAALSSVPWIGSVIGAGANFSAESDQEKLNDLQRFWLLEHREKVHELMAALTEIINRLDGFGEEIDGRLASPGYLALVKKTFRSWDQAETQDKKQMLKKLIANAAAIKLCPDDLIRLFINWIDLYHEAHFLVIKHIYLHPGITHGAIWDQIHGPRVREDSAEADLFRYLIRDLSTGGVIRQARETNAEGAFLRNTSPRRPSHVPAGTQRTMESAFEDTKPYVLTELGKQFVHYVMEDVVLQLQQPAA